MSLLIEVSKPFVAEGRFDVDRAKGPSPEVLEVGNKDHSSHIDADDVAPQLLLEFEGTDVDPQDKLDGNTPLHYAVQLSHPDARSWTVRSLLDAGGCAVTDNISCASSLSLRFCTHRRRYADNKPIQAKGGGSAAARF